MSTVEMEKVLVVPTQLFHDLGHFQGFSADVDRYVDTLLNPDNTDYRTRGEMENDPSFKQLIPYVIFQYQSEPKSDTGSDSGIQVFQYTRGKGQGEARLHSKKSVGIGGHISSIDSDMASVYDQGMRRELEEETVINTNYTERCVGMINDDETDVGKVHLGIVHIFEVKTPDVRAREEDICEAGFRPVEQILGEIDGYETWSQICLKALFGQLTQTQ